MEGGLCYRISKCRSRLVLLGLTFGGTVESIVKGRTLHGPADLFRCIIASGTSRGCQTDNTARLSCQKQNDHLAVKGADEGTSEWEEIVGVRCAKNDREEIMYCRRDQEAASRVLAHTRN